MSDLPPPRPAPRHPDVDERSLERLHRGLVFDVARVELTLPSGLEQRLELVLHSGAVAIAAVREDGRIAVVRQYRAAVGDWTEELPAGRLEPGEQPLDAARRELEEETRLVGADWALLHRMVPAVGFCSEIVHVFVARGLTDRGDSALAPDEDEEIDVLWRTPAELLAADPLDSKTALAAALLGRA